MAPPADEIIIEKNCHHVTERLSLKNRAIKLNTSLSPRGSGEEKKSQAMRSTVIPSVGQKRRGEKVYQISNTRNVEGRGIQRRSGNDSRRTNVLAATSRSGVSSHIRRVCQNPGRTFAGRFADELER